MSATRKTRPLTRTQIVLLSVTAVLPSLTLTAMHFHLFAAPLNALVAFLHSF